MWKKSRVYGKLPPSLTSPSPVRTLPAAPSARSYGTEGPSAGLFIVQALKADLWWQENAGELRPLAPNDPLPPQAPLLLRVYVQLEAPALWVEERRLAILGESLPSDWTAMQLEPSREQAVDFVMPRSTTPGQLRARIMARSQAVERRSTLIEVTLPDVKRSLVPPESTP